MSEAELEPRAKREAWIEVGVVLALALAPGLGASLWDIANGRPATRSALSPSRPPGSGPPPLHHVAQRRALERVRP